MRDTELRWQSTVPSILYPSHPPLPTCHLDLDTEPRITLESKGQGIWKAFRGHVFGLASVFHEGRDSRRILHPGSRMAYVCINSRLGRTRMEEWVGSYEERWFVGPGETLPLEPARNSGDFMGEGFKALE